MRTLTLAPKVSQILLGLERNPKNPLLRRHLVEAYLGEQLFKEAGEAANLLIKLKPTWFADTLLLFEQAALNNPYNLTIRLALADIYQAAGHTEDAVMELEDVLELDPNRLEAAQSLSRLYYKLGRGPEVIQILDHIHDWSKGDLHMVTFMAKAYFRERLWDKAALLYEHCYQVQSDIFVLKSLFEIYVQLQQFDALTRTGTRIIHDFPASADWLRDQLERIVRQFPAYRDAYRILSRAYLSTLQPDDAVRVLRDLIKVDASEATAVAKQLQELLQQFPQFPPAIYELALIEIRSKSYTPALTHLQFLLSQHWETYQEKIIRCLELILQAQPDQVLALRMMGDVYIKLGKVTEASDIYRRLVEISPLDRQALLLRLRDIFEKDAPGTAAPLLILGCEMALANNDIDLAQRWLLQLKQDPDAVGVSHYLEALIERHHGRIAKALSLLAEANVARPFDTPIHAAVRDCLQKSWQGELDKVFASPDAAERIPKLYYDMGRIDEAAEAIQRSGTEDVALRLLLARCFKELGRFDLALRQLKHLCELDPRRVLFELGTLQEVVGDLEGAIDTYKNLQQLDLTFPGLGARIEAIGSTTMVHIRGKLVLPLLAYRGQQRLLPLYVRNLEVEQWVKKHKNKLSPSLANPHNDRAVVHIFSGQWKAAEEELLLAQNLDPGLTAVQINWGTLCVMKGDYAAALQHVEKAENLNSRLSATQHLRAMVELLSGDASKAISHFQGALAQDRKSLASCLNLGDLLYAAGKVEPAIEMWERQLQSYLLSELAYRRLREACYGRYHESLLQPVRPTAK